MAVAREPAARARLPSERRPAAPPLALGDGAWLLSVACAALLLPAIVVLAPPLGRVLLVHHPVTFWPSVRSLVHPEPTEQARFLLALCAAPLLVAGIAVLARRPLRIGRSATLARVVQAAWIALALVCLLAQRRFTYGPVYSGVTNHQQYFTNATLAASLAGALALLAAARSGRAVGLLAALTRESRGRRLGAALVAVLLTAVWLLHALNTEGTVGSENRGASYHLQFTLDETFAVLDGRSPLVDFVAQYGFLWPYLVAAAMAPLGHTVGAFSALMVTLSGVAVLAVYVALRRVTRSAWGGLLLFGPFLATSFFMLHGPLENRYTSATIFSDYPLRFAGPWLLLWLTARHLDGARPRGRWPLFLAAGLVVLNNVDHGVPALGAVLAAVVAAERRPTWALARRLALELLAGLAGALALVAALTLVRAGALPDLGQLVRFARIFAASGYALLPMPTLGVHTIVYLTFVAAIALAAVRALAGDPDRLLTGMLAWSGVFGLGAGGYYAGRSDPEVLVASFAAWALALGLLALIVLRRLAARPRGWPAPAEAAVLLAFCITVCSLAQTPTPWSQVRRLRTDGPPAMRTPTGQPFVAAHARPGERVAILMLLGHRMADTLGIADVAPYTGSQSMPTVEQLDETVAALREAGGRKLFLWVLDAYPEMPRALQQRGFRLAAAERASGMTMWVDGAAAAAG